MSCVWFGVWDECPLLVARTVLRFNFFTEDFHASNRFTYLNFNLAGIVSFKNPASS